MSNRLKSIALSVLVLYACAVGESARRRSSRPAPATGEFAAHGKASYYGHDFHGKLTANGERFDMHAMTAAHKTLPFGTRIKVRCREAGRSVIVRINDRGPFVAGRIIDVSYGAARKLGILERGVVHVQVEVAN